MAIETSGQLEAAKRERDDLVKRQKDFKKSESRLNKLRRSTYSATEKGYKVDGKIISTSEYNKEIQSLNNQIETYNETKKNNERRIKELDDAIKNASIASGFSAQQQAIGDEYNRLRKEASAIKVTDFESGLRALQAWKNVEQFALENPDGVFVERTGSAGSGKRKVDLQRTQKLSDRTDELQRTINGIITQTDKFASEGLVSFERKYVREGGKTKLVYERNVLDPAALESRRGQIAAITGVSPVDTEQGQQGQQGSTIGAATRKIGTTLAGAAKGKAQPATQTTGTAAPGAVPGTTQTTTRPTTGGGTGGGGGGTTRSTRPANPKVGEKWTGPKGVTWEWNGSKWKSLGKTPVQGTQQWNDIIQEEFGSLWSIYNDNEDVKNVIDLSVKEGWYNDTVKLNNKLRNTSWYRQTQDSVRQFMIQKDSDPATMDSKINAQTDLLRSVALENGYEFDDPTLRRLAEDSIKYGYSDNQVKIMNSLGGEAVAQARAGGPQAVSELAAGAVGQNLRKIAAAYAQRPTDQLIEQWTQEIMSGLKTDKQFTELMTSSAKTQFRSLRDALDKGQDVQTAMFAYQQQASRILGDAYDTSEIDWTSDKWNAAMNYKDEKTGEYRQMDLWEWNKYLRKLPEWQETEDAKNTYRNVGLALARGFGKMA